MSKDLKRFRVTDKDSVWVFGAESLEDLKIILEEDCEVEEVKNV